MSRNKLIYWNLFALFVIAVLYKNVELLHKDKYIFVQNQKINLNTNAVELKENLVKQNYLLKIKFVKTGVQDKIITFNGQVLKPYATKAKKLIETDLVAIPGGIVKDSNILRIVFPKQYPENIDVRMSNSRKLLNGDMVIFFDKRIVKSDIKRAIGLSIILSLLFLVFVKVVNALWRVDSKVIFYGTLISLSPFFGFLLIINSISLFASFKIFISPYFIKFWLPCTFMSLFIIVNFRYIKLKHKDKLFIFVLNLLVFLFIFSILEISTRIYIHAHYPNNIFKLSSADLSYLMTPNFKGNFSGTMVILNSQGQRDKEHSFKKEPNTYRILCVGDSMVFGYGVSQDDPFPAQLQRMLSTNKETNYEVINTAVPGHDTYQERLYFEKVGLKYNPDLVIVGICMNDITGGVAALGMLGTLIDVKGGYYSYADMPAFSKLQYFSIRHSYFFQYCLLKFRAILDKYKPKEKYIWGYSKGSLDYYAGLVSPEEKRREGLFKKELLKIKDLTQDVKLLLLIFPNDIQLLSDNLTKPQKMIEAFCNENAISFIDLLSLFRRNINRGLFVDIGHPSVFGHRLVAEEIFKYMKENSWVN